MIEEYRRAKKGRLQRRAMAVWRKLEARQALARFEQPLERVIDRSVIMCKTAQIRRARSR